MNLLQAMSALSAATSAARVAFANATRCLPADDSFSFLAGDPAGSSVDACRLRFEPELSLLKRVTEFAPRSVLSPTLDGLRFEVDESDDARLVLLPGRPGWSLCASYDGGWNRRTPEDADTGPDSDRPVPPPDDPLLCPREGPALLGPVGELWDEALLPTVSLKSSTTRRRCSSGPKLLLWLLGPPPPLLPEYAREEETGVPRPSCGGKPGGGPGLLLLREVDGVQRCTGALSRESLCSLLPLLPLLSLRAGADNAGIGVGSSQGLMMVWGTDVAGTRPAEAGGLGGFGGSCGGGFQVVSRVSTLK